MESQEIDLSFLKVLYVKDMKKQHPYNKAHDRKQIANAYIDYHGVKFQCALIKGKDKSSEKSYFFVEMPCIYFFQSVGEKKWKKKNMVNLGTRKEVDQFQALMLIQINKMRPDLFLEKEPVEAS